jgi:hypothetical protein
MSQQPKPKTLPSPEPKNARTTHPRRTRATAERFLTRRTQARGAGDVKPPDVSFEMKNADPSKLALPQLPPRQRLTNPTPATPHFKTQKNPSATHVLKSHPSKPIPVTSHQSPIARPTTVVARNGNARERYEIARRFEPPAEPGADGRVRMGSEVAIQPPRGTRLRVGRG